MHVLDNLPQFPSEAKSYIRKETLKQISLWISEAW